MHTTGAPGLSHTQPMMGKALVMILMLADSDPDQLLIHVANRWEIHLFAQFKAAFNNCLSLNFSKSMQIQANTLGMNKFWTADQTVQDFLCGLPLLKFREMTTRFTKVSS